MDVFDAFLLMFFSASATSPHGGSKVEEFYFRAVSEAQGLEQNVGIVFARTFGLQVGFATGFVDRKEHRFLEH